MLGKLRKSSTRVTLVLIGVAAISGCGRSSEQRRDVYASKEDCLADWANKPEDCTPATESRHAGSGFFYGPLYAMGALNSWRNNSGSSWTSGGARSGSRAIGSSSSGISRGGFGSSGFSSGG
jgi:uncharacterized protein YgiB involved in biofilm formation